MNIGIVGAGLAGRLCAFELAQRGHQLCVFDASQSPSPALGETRAAAWTSAGMLSPIAEMESGGAPIRDLGKRSLTLWQSVNDSLIDTAAENHLPNPDSPLGLELSCSLMVCHASDIGAAQRVIRLLDQDPTQIEPLQASDLPALAPAIKGTLHAWRLVGEGHLYPARAMQSLYLSTPGVQWRWGARADAIEPHEITIGATVHRFDWVIDTRGTGASSALSVRGVRGEIMVLHAPDFDLRCAVRLLHPRWRVYIVPRPHDQVVIGATEIESEDRSPISVQSTMELLSAAFSIFPSLAEARVLWSDVNLRPATPDNLPVIETTEGLTQINGLFRHGWLLAPAVIEKGLSDAGLS
jgi:glycine oxidase